MSLSGELIKADKALDSILSGTERRIVRAHANSLVAIRSELAQVYAKYEKAGELTYAEMAKYGRLQGLEADIRKELNSLTGKTVRAVDSGNMAGYAESYYRTVFGIEGEAQAKLGYSMLNKNTIQRAIDNPLEKLALRRNAANIKITMSQQITQGLIQGESYTKMASRVKDTLESNTNNALRIARTEAHRAQQLGRKDSTERASELGVEMEKVWDASLDDRTRDSHQSLDGVAVGVDEDFYNPETGGRGPVPGSMGTAEDDINCRCSVRYQIKGYSPEVRNAREEGTIPYQTYEEYAKARGWKKQNGG